ncbi:retropepsin-like aspartic protease family protein [Chitinilyticum piscinae]|uniref:Retroviral-like aspartic protease family protein n=1 Tax=Chitinilyticum piscinae TaxID=2866724 RepID=A0A8J7FMT1_9NEIS|nr:retropepsin-like aspartic protease [Chitinilyticum piscinae]MBE9609436.1 retroviral-like aspartic protease family protein [Chitinilyticum piscinae]
MLRSTPALILLWLSVLGGGYWLFSGLLAERQAPAVRIAGDGSLTIPRSADGHYRSSGSIAGQRVLFMLDTGATSVTIDQALAERLGLPRGTRVTTQTANGSVEGYETVLPELDLPPFRLEQVRAIVVPHLGDELLLGMNVLNRFDILLRDGAMVLEQRK